MNLGQAIRDNRVRLNVTQAELADRLGSSQKVISKYERDACRPPIDTVVAMAHIFGISTDDLLGSHSEDPNLRDNYFAEEPIHPDYEYLRALRKRRGISQETMSSILGYSSKSSYCLIESGKGAVNTQSAATISTALGLTRDEFLDAFFPGLFQVESIHAERLSTDPIEAILSVFDRKYRISLSIAPSGEELNG